MDGAGDAGGDGAAEGAGEARGVWGGALRGVREGLLAARLGGWKVVKVSHDAACFMVFYGVLWCFMVDDGLRIKCPWYPMVLMVMNIHTHP